MFHNSYKESYESVKKGRSRRRQYIPGTSVLAVTEPVPKERSAGLDVMMKLEQPQLKTHKKKRHPVRNTASVHNWNDSTQHMVFALGKNNDLNVRNGAVPGTSKIRISKTKTKKKEKGTTKENEATGANA